MNADVDTYKRQAAERAAEQVESGMIVGLGTGSTAAYALRRLAERLAAGELTDILGVPTSERTREEAQRLGIPLTTLDEYPEVDLTIDGADEVDSNLDVIKGGGGALLREKVVAQASRRVIIVVDDSKLVEALGTRAAVPLEVVPFARGSELTFLRGLGAEVRLRAAEGGGGPFLTDQGNCILDVGFGPIDDPTALAALLDGRAGIVGHGLFIELATDVIVAGAGGIRERERWKTGL